MIEGVLGQKSVGARSVRIGVSRLPWAAVYLGTSFDATISNVG